MSDADDSKPKPLPKPGHASGAGRSGSARSIGEELGGLDFEPDALLDSLLSDEGPGESAPPPGPPLHVPDERDFPEDEVTVIASATELARAAQEQASARRDVGADVDDLLDGLSESAAPPAVAAPAAPPRPPPRPAPPRPPPRRPPPRPPTTAQPPSVNPAGPPPRQPFPPAMSPAAPPAEELPFADDSFDLEELDIKADAPPLDARATPPHGVDASHLAASVPSTHDAEPEAVEPDAIPSVEPQAPSEPSRDTEVGAPPAIAEPESPDAVASLLTTEPAEPEQPAAPPPVTVPGDERPAAAHLRERDELDVFRARAEWLESEAGARPDPQSKARALVIASELWAMAGDVDRARKAAAEAVAVQPTSVVAQRQLRLLAAAEGDWKSVATILEGEARSAPTGEGRAHATYLSAEIHRIALGDAAMAQRKLDALARLAPADARAPVAKAAEAMAASAEAPSLELAEEASLKPLRAAIANIVRMRGGSADGVGAIPAVLFEEARRALSAGDRAAAGRAVSKLAEISGLEQAARWLAAALLAPAAETRPEAIAALQQLSSVAPSRAARRALAARALEQNDADATQAALGSDDDSFSVADRVALAALTGGGRQALAPWLAGLADQPRLGPLSDAASSAASPAASPAAVTSGGDAERAEVGLGRAVIAQLVAEADPTLLPSALEAYATTHPDEPLAQLLALELSLTANDPEAVAEALAAWPGEETPEGRRDRHAAAALVLEMAGDTDAACREYAAVLGADPTHEGAVRALLAHAPPSGGAELLSSLASSSTDPTFTGLLLTEAALRLGDEPTADELIERAAEEDPRLPFAQMLGMARARARGDAAGVVKCLRARREGTSDPIERALDGVREALLIADSDSTLAVSLLEEALSARPTDVGLRELCERMSPGSGTDRGAWREEVASAAAPSDRSGLLLDAALEYERAGDVEAAARAAQAAAELGGELVKITAERLAASGPGAAALADELLTRARQEQDPKLQRELYERLGTLDRARGESSAVLWDTAILESDPAYLPSLRRLEHEYVGSGRSEELEPIAATLAPLLDRAEASAHAQLAARARLLAGDRDGARQMVDLAVKLEPPPLWALRALSALARHTSDDQASFETDSQLSERASRAMDAATLALRASEAATRLDKVADAKELLDRAVELMPEHLIALSTQAEVLEKGGDFARAAEAMEAVAAASSVDAHRLDAWYSAGVLWSEHAGDSERGLSCLERAAELDLRHADVFERLRSLYIAKDDRTQLAELLERRLDQTEDPDERVALEVTRGRALAEVGDREAAKLALAAALDANPDHVEALDAYAELSVAEGDWEGAEQAWIRLARSATDPDRQVAIYRKLGNLYETELPNPQRAELAYKEIIKRHPNDVGAVERLVFVYGRLGDAAKSIQMQTELVGSAGSPEDKRDRTLVLAQVYEELAGDRRKAETTLDRARKTWPQDGVVLRALAEFYQRHGENTALNVLLDRAANDSRRALSTGRFDPGLFASLATVAELRGGTDAAAIAHATLDALEGRETEVTGAGPSAADPRLDELIAPELLTLPLRALLKKSGDTLDAAYAVDLRTLRATPLPQESQGFVGQLQQLATRFGINGLEVYSSPSVGKSLLPLSSVPARIVFGTELLESGDETLRNFLVVRALKIIQGMACTLARTAPIDLWPVVAGYLSVFATNWAPPNVDAKKLADAQQRIRSAISRRLDDDVPVLALEVIGSIGNRASQLGTAVNQWGNRTALLVTGDPNTALAAVALASGHDEGPPSDGVERLKWIVRNPEARDLAVFSVSEQYAEARRRLGVAS